MRSRQPLPRYPWDKWFRRKKFVLRRGRDFMCMTHGMAVQVRTAAKNRNLQVSVMIEEDNLRIVLKRCA